MSGDELGGLNYSSYAGIELDDIGDVIALAARGADGAGGPSISQTGEAQIWEYDSINNIWKQRGSTIEGKTIMNYQLGYYITLSADGKRVALGTYTSMSPTTSREIRVYEYNESSKSWGHITDISGRAMSMSKNGKVVAAQAQVLMM